MKRNRLSKSAREWLKRESENAHLFHVDMDTLTESERQFVQHARERMRKVHRPSWPDFIVDDEGMMFAVEVKTPADGLSANQIRTFNLLTSKGIMNIYVWTSDKPGRLIKWEKARTKL